MITVIKEKNCYINLGISFNKKKEKSLKNVSLADQHICLLKSLYADIYDFADQPKVTKLENLNLKLLSIVHKN